MNKIFRIFSAPSATRQGALVGNASKRCNSDTVTLGSVTHYLRRAAVMLLLCMFTAVGAWANSLVDYNFDTGEDQSKWITLTDNAKQLIGPKQDNAASSLTDIGFSFPFGNGTYTQFWVNSNGILSFSSTPANSSSPQFDSSDISANQPKICGISKDLSTGDNGYVKYELTGTSPNRILVCEFYTYHNNAIDGSAIYRWQVQLHEAGAKVVIIYDYFNTSSHSWSMRDYQIGLSQSDSDIWTVNPQTHVATHATKAVSEKYSARPGNYRYYEFTPLTQENINLAIAELPEPVENTTICEVCGKPGAYATPVDPNHKICFDCRELLHCNHTGWVTSNPYADIHGGIGQSVISHT